MINYTALLFILLEPVLAGTGAGWFASIRGGQLNQHPNSIYIYPRALSNIGYAYGHLKDDNDHDNDAGSASKHERKDIVNVKSTSTTQQHKKKWSDNEFEEEDHFFHSLYHNNDENKVVTNVSNKKIKNEEEDVILFGRLNDRLFHRRRGNTAQVQQKEEDGTIDSDNVAHLKYGIEEAFKEFTFFE